MDLIEIYKEQKNMKSKYDLSASALENYLKFKERKIVRRGN